MKNLDRDGLDKLNRSRYLTGVNLQTRHQPDDTGCCHACGRPDPCDASRVGARMTAAYAQWATVDAGSAR